MAWCLLTMCSSVAWWPKCRRGTAQNSDRARQGFEVLQRNSIGLIFIFCKRIPAQKDWSWTKMMAWPLFGVDPDVLLQQNLSMEECVRSSGMVRAWSLWWDATQEKRRPNKRGGVAKLFAKSIWDDLGFRWTLCFYYKVTLLPSFFVPYLATYWLIGL